MRKQAALCWVLSGRISAQFPGEVINGHKPVLVRFIGGDGFDKTARFPVAIQ